MRRAFWVIFAFILVAGLAVGAVAGCSGGSNNLNIVGYTLTVSSTDGGNVTVPGEGNFTRDPGSIVDLLAIPDAGYYFVNWTGNVSTVANVNAANTTITMNASYAIRANLAAKYVLVDDSYSGKQVDLAVGQSLVVTLDSNASTGYSWSLAQNSDETVLNKTGNEYISPQTTLVGAGGKEEWTFKALKKGTSSISMVYSRPWETDTPPAKTFDLTVVVK